MEKAPNAPPPNSENVSETGDFYTSLRLQSLLKDNLDTILLVGPDGTIQSASPSVAILQGYDEKEYNGRKWFEFIHPDDVGAMAELSSQLINKPGGYIRQNVRCLHKEGSWRWMEVTMTNLMLGPEVQGIIVNYRDITVQKDEERGQSELNLEERNRELQVLYDVGRQLSKTIHLKEVYWMIFKEIGMNLLGCPHLIIALYDEETQTIRCDFAITDGEETDPTVFSPLPLGEGPTSDAIRTRQPAIIDLESARRQLEPKGRYTQIGDERLTMSALYVPLISGDKVLGVLSVQHYEANAFEDTDLNLLVTLSNQASIAIQNAQHVERIQQNTLELEHHLSELKRASETLKNSETSFRHLFANNPHPMWVHDRESLSFVEVNEVAIFNYGYSREEFLTMRITDIHSEADVPKLMASVKNERTAFEAALGWRHKLKNGSLIDVEVTSHTLEFDNRPCALVVAKDVTESNRNRTFLFRREAILEAVSFASQQFLQSHSWRDNINAVLQQLGEATEVSRVYLFKNEITPDGELATSQQNEWAAPGISPQIDNPDLQTVPYQAVGLGEWVINMTKREMISGNVREFSEDVQSILAPQDILSIVVVPVYVGEVWWGFIGFDDCWREREWVVPELETLRTAANILGAAIQRERSEAALQRRNEELAGLHEIAETISVLTAPRETYQLLTERLANLLNAEMCLVALLNESENEIQAQIPGYGLSEDWLHSFRYRVEQGLAVWDFTVGGSIYFNDPRDIPDFYQPFTQTLQLDSVLAAPMMVGEVFAGIIFAANKPGGFNEEDGRLLQMFASQAGLVIDKMRLFEKTQQQILNQYVLHAVSGATVEVQDEDELITRVTDEIGELLYTDNFGILLLEKNTGYLRVHPSYRGVTQMDKERKIPLDGKSVSSFVITSGKPYLSRDVTQTPFYLKIDSEIRSELCVPLKIGDEMIGVINAESRQTNNFRVEDQILLTTLAGQLSTAIERLRAGKQEREQRALAEALRDAAVVLNSRLDFDAILENMLDIVERVVPHITATLMLFRNGIAKVIRHRGFDKLGDTSWLNDYQLDIEQAKNLREIVNTRRPVVISETENDPRWLLRNNVEWIRSYIGVPILQDNEVIGVLNLDHDTPGYFNESHAESLKAFASQVAVALENSRLYEAELQRTTELTSLLHVSSELRHVSNRMELFTRILEQIKSLVDAAGTFIGLHDSVKGDIFIELGQGIWKTLTGSRMAIEECPCGNSLTTGQIYSISDFDSETTFPHMDIAQGLSSIVCIPLNTQNLNLGVLGVGSTNELNKNQIRILTGVANIAAGSVHRVGLLDQTTQRLQRLVALRTIDHAINASLDLQFTLNLLLDQIFSQLKVDAANVLLFNPSLHTLEHAAGKGFYTLSVKQSHLRLGQGPAGRAVRNRKSIFIPRVRDETESAERAKMIIEEGFISYLAIPLIAKGQVLGVLEIFQRSSLEPDFEWLDFLDTLAEQAAIAINNAQLFNDLKHTNHELIRMYDSTLEGWVYALDLRDKETEGHSKRVVELTMQLAQVMGIAQNEMIHIRRGALLHDIGKIGVPDSILHKPGKLAEDEWEIMRLHPEYAYNMLYPVSFLRPALEIPYCHHEKWDGTGYPRGLKGEEIPISARIFAIVDVWDALRSDRPYRKAWPNPKVIKYIKSQKGTHFDPEVVNQFIKIMEEEEEELISWHPS